MLAKKTRLKHLPSYSIGYARSLKCRFLAPCTFRRRTLGSENLGPHLGAHFIRYQQLEWVPSFSCASCKVSEVKGKGHLNLLSYEAAPSCEKHVPCGERNMPTTSKGWAKMHDSNLEPSLARPCKGFVLWFGNFVMAHARGWQPLVIDTLNPLVASYGGRFEGAMCGHYIWEQSKKK